MAEAKLSQLKSLPSLPEVAVRLLELIGDPSSSVSDLNKVMSKDPVLTATTLRIVNSSYHGLRHKVTALSHALTLLGFRTVKNIILTAAASGIFRKARPSPCFNPYAFMRHSVASAAVCRFLGNYSQSVDPETAFSVGLLEDIGKLVLNECFPEDYQKAVKLAKEKGVEVHVAERALWEFDHGTLGAMMGGHWKLPPSLCEAILHHHDLAGAADKGIAAICLLSNYICAIKKVPTADGVETAELSQEAWKPLKIDPAVLSLMLASIDPEMEEAEDLYNLVSAEGVAAAT